MRNILVRSMIVAIASTVLSLAIASIVMPALGGSLDMRAIVMCIVCPLAIAWPASAHAMVQKRRLHAAHARLEEAHRDLAAAHAKLSEKARRDDMTGMLNRENFFATAGAGKAKHDESALLVIDVDNFGTVNDSCGHQTGDEALLEITAAICRAAGKDGTIGRIGGEEFGVFLPATPEGKARLIGERIRREVEQIVFKSPEGRRILLTVSIGGASATRETPLSDTMRLADRRLHEAKRRGRNRLVYEIETPRAA